MPDAKMAWVNDVETLHSSKVEHTITFEAITLPYSLPSSTYMPTPRVFQSVFRSTVDRWVP